MENIDSINTTVDYYDLVKQADVVAQVNKAMLKSEKADFIVISMNMDGGFYPSIAIDSKQGFSGDLIERLTEASVEYAALAVVIVSIVADELDLYPTEVQNELAIDLQNVFVSTGVMLHDFQMMKNHSYYSFFNVGIMN